MKRFWRFGAIVALVLMSGLLTFGQVSAPNSLQGKMADNNNDFACKLFRTINEQKGGDTSTIVSPISVSYLLGMLHEGADGKTRQQINDVLGLGGSVEQINKYFKKKMDEASKVDPKVTVKTANCIFFKSGQKLIPQYKADMQKYYDAQIEATNFNSSNIVNKINNWCKTHTDGMIPELVKKEEVNRNRLAVMYLLNAVYFKASWTKEFDPQETRDMVFKKQDCTTVKHKIMHLETRAAYGQNDLCEMLCLPYGKGDYSMYALLPCEGKTIGDVIQSLSAQKLEKQRKQEMTTCKVDILLPCFTSEMETNLIGVLSSMGMPLAFSEKKAEFPNMLQGHNDDLYVSLMKQKAKIEVNEEGTKAAAVTVAEMSEKGIDYIETFHALRPFIYYIVENNTGTILFMGTYCGEEGVALAPGEVVPEKSNVTRTRVNVTRPIPNVTNDKPNEEIFKAVEQMPQFSGGEAALMKYIDSHINYPPMAAQNNVQGRVILQFVVDKTGKVGEVKVVRSVDKDLDNEAVRIIKTLPEFTPGRQNGQAVSVWYTLPVTFKLPQEDNKGLNN